MYLTVGSNEEACGSDGAEVYFKRIAAWQGTFLCSEVGPSLCDLLLKGIVVRKLVLLASLGQLKNMEKCDKDRCAEQSLGVKKCRCRIPKGMTRAQIVACRGVTWGQLQPEPKPSKRCQRHHIRGNRPGWCRHLGNVVCCRRLLKLFK